MATTPATAVDGVLWNAAAQNTHTTAITEIQQSGVLLDLTSTAQCDSTSSAVPIAGFNGATFTIPGSASRRVYLTLSNSILNGTAVGIIIAVGCSFSSATVRAQVWNPAAGGPGQQDGNRSGAAVVLAPGAYTVVANVARSGVAGTASLLVGAKLQVIDIGPA